MNRERYSKPCPRGCGNRCDRKAQQCAACHNHGRVTEAPKTRTERRMVSCLTAADLVCLLCGERVPLTEGQAALVAQRVVRCKRDGGRMFVEFARPERVVLVEGVAA